MTPPRCLDRSERVPPHTECVQVAHRLRIPDPIPRLGQERAEPALEPGELAQLVEGEATDPHVLAPFKQMLETLDVPSIAPGSRGAGRGRRTR